MIHSQSCFRSCCGFPHILHTGTFDKLMRRCWNSISEDTLPGQEDDMVLDPEWGLIRLIACIPLLLDTWIRSQTLSGEPLGAMGKGSQIGRLSFLRSSSQTSSPLSLSPEPESWKSSSWGWQEAKHSFLELKLLEFPCKIYWGLELLGTICLTAKNIYLTSD